ncbi:hypothetical protein MMC25_006452 [Agyrium rufum]|nr:hypothetical protein [Agyrium rufum]
MAYILYSVIFFSLVAGTLLYLTRSRWTPLVTPYIPTPLSRAIDEYFYSRLPTSFAGDIEEGFTSSDFDLTGNLEGGDSRAGLDDTAKREIRIIMRNKRVDFDEGRRIYTEQRFAKNGIGPDGRPRDPKFVSFS